MCWCYAFGGGGGAGCGCDEKLFTHFVWHTQIFTVVVNCTDKNRYICVQATQLIGKHMFCLLVLCLWK